MLIVLALLASLLGGTAAGTLGATTATQSKATLRLVSVSPLSVRGVHFKGRERVRVVAKAASTTRSRTIRTTSSGGFRVSFGSVTFDRCADLVVTATGRHDRATLKLPQPECPPA